MTQKPEALIYILCDLTYGITVYPVTGSLIKRNRDNKHIQIVCHQVFRAADIRSLCIQFREQRIRSFYDLL